MRPKIIVFASGTKDGGGSGFENLVEATKDGRLDADIVAVVSNHAEAGVKRRAERLGIPFIYFNPSEHSYILKNMRVSGGYADIVKQTGAEWIALSGWLRKTEALDPQKTFNIHPALLSQLNHRFGGKGMYAHHIHDAVKAAFDAGEITESGFSMHFVTEEMDRGPVFFEHRVPLAAGMSADDIAKAVNKAEHEWQPKVTNAMVHGRIHWDGKDPKSLVVPPHIA